MVVKSELDKLGLHYIRVELGEIMEDISTEQIDSLKVALKSTGLTPSHCRNLKYKRCSALVDV